MENACCLVGFFSNFIFELFGTYVMKQIFFTFLRGKHKIMFKIRKKQNTIIHWIDQWFIIFFFVEKICVNMRKKAPKDSTTTIGSPENAACFYSRGARDSLV